jgi:hypothetical protein
MPHRKHKSILACVALSMLCLPETVFARLGNENAPPYVQDGDHPWHSLSAALFVRTGPDGVAYSHGQLDILYWSTTKHLLSGPSHETALRAMDDFIAGHAAAKVRDPLERAWLQRDTWALFDWIASAAPDDPFPQQRAELNRRLALIVRSLALTPEEIASLPSTADRTMPNAETSDWLVIGTDLDGPTAFEHARAFGGRSVFLVLARFPAGPAEGRAYLKALRESPNPWLPAPLEGSPFGTLNPAVPQFPAGTEWALVRRLCLIDTLGKIQVSPLVESIQHRRYRLVPAPNGARVSPFDAQAFSQLEMRFDRRGALHPLSATDTDFQHVHFLGMGIDLFELSSSETSPEQMRKPTLRTCASCHQSPGVTSVLSYNNIFSGTRPHPVPLRTSDFAQEADKTLRWKYAQREWQELMQQ